MGKKAKDPNKLTGKSYLGASLLSSTNGLTASLMSTFFMLYLTDYSGLGAYAASLGSAILVFARVFDAVNDPLEGWIIQRAKPGKNGKYRNFTWLSLLLSTIGVILMFWIPQAIVNTPVMVTIYIIVAYLLYDIGGSFFVPDLIYRSMTLDEKERGRMYVWPRMVVMLWGMIASAMISIVTAVNVAIGNLHTSFGITVCIVTVLAAIVSFIGSLMIKEKYIAAEEEAERVGIKDMLLILKENVPFRIKLCAGLFGGFVYTLMYATSTYYAKWAYCADLTTGAVDTAKFGTYTLLISMISFTPLIVGTFVGNPLTKAMKEPQRAMILLYAIQGGSLGLLFILHIIGLLPKMPVIFFVCLVIAAFAMGAIFPPQGIMNLETMDYDIYKNDKDRAAIQNAVSKVIEKAQSALATAIVGMSLTAVGYIVDSETDVFLGNLNKMPVMLTMFAVIFGLAPLFCSAMAILFFRKYPINNKVREEMKAALAKEEQK